MGRINQTRRTNHAMHLEFIMRSSFSLDLTEMVKESSIKIIKEQVSADICSG